MVSGPALDAEGRQENLCRSDRGELLVKARECHTVHLMGRDGLSAGSDAVEGGAGIIDHPHTKAEITCHSSRGRNAVVGGDANNDERVYTTGPQISLESGSYESAVDGLG